MTSEYGLTIYRNDEFVEDLIQQIFNIGLPIDEIRETLQASAEKKARETAGNAGASAGFDIPFLSSAKADLSGSVKATGSNDARDEHKNQLKFQYTQANFLHNIRRHLRANDLMWEIGDVASVQDLEVGYFRRVLSHL